jgi:hypothetical protein
MGQVAAKDTEKEMGGDTEVKALCDHGIPVRYNQTKEGGPMKSAAFPFVSYWLSLQGPYKCFKGILMSRL